MMRPIRQPLRQYVEQTPILNMVQRTPEADRLATVLLTRHNATDLLEILDLT